MNFAAALDRVETALAPGGWQWAVAGGIALAAYGNPRLTLDLDIVTESAAQDALVSVLEAAGYATLYRSSGFSNHRHANGEWGRIDVIYVNDATARQMFDSVRSVEGPSGRAIRVPRPEHLIAMKVQAMKNDPDRTGQDLVDIAYLLTIPGIDRSEAREYFAKAGLIARWEEVARGR